MKKYNTVIVVGTSFGDEGKGKFVDILSEKSDMVCRFNGSCNAGHTIIINGKKVILRLIPCGILRPDVICVLAQGMVIDADVFTQELETLRKLDVNVTGRLFVSDAAHLVTPDHIARDIASEESAGDKKIGTTRKGIGPAYEDKVTRKGFRLGSLKTYNGDDVYLLRAKKAFVPYLIDTSEYINSFIDAGKNVLFEGSQGTLLDIDHGTYPYVTSSSCIAGGACTGSGVGPTRINHTVGVTKAYVTRVGEGPFPTELNNDIAERIRSRGQEFGSVTRRPRRVGWLDLPALRYAVRVNGLDSLAIAKLDVLSGLDDVMVSIGNDKPLIGSKEWGNGTVWSEDLTKMRTYDELPESVRLYLGYIEKFVGVPISLISVGPDRNETIVVDQIFD